MRIVRSTDRTYIPASHEDQNKPGVLKKVLATKDELLDGKVQMINWAQLPVGSSFRLHYHEDMEEAFILIRGKAEMRVGSELLELLPGDSVFVEPREHHEMKNTGDEVVEYIVLGISQEKGGKTIVVE